MSNFLLYISYVVQTSLVARPLQAYSYHVSHDRRCNRTRSCSFKGVKNIVSDGTIYAQTSAEPNKVKIVCPWKVNDRLVPLCFVIDLQYGSLLLARVITSMGRPPPLKARWVNVFFIGEILGGVHIRTKWRIDEPKLERIPAVRDPPCCWPVGHNT